MTLEQFRAWLSGVEDMQDDDWTPSPTQWKKIRSKFDEIEVPIQSTAPTYPPVARSYQVQPLMEPAPSLIPMMEPTLPPPPQMRFESDIVHPPVSGATPGNVPPNANGTYRSGFV